MSLLFIPCNLYALLPVMLSLPCICSMRNMIQTVYLGVKSIIATHAVCSGIGS